VHLEGRSGKANQTRGQGDTASVRLALSSWSSPTLQLAYTTKGVTTSSTSPLDYAPYVPIRTLIWRVVVGVEAMEHHACREAEGQNFLHGISLSLVLLRAVFSH